MTIAPSPRRIFYGWFVLAAAFTVMFIGLGGAYTFGAFVEPLQKEFAASRGSVSLVFATAGCLYFAFGVISGPLADRWGSRTMALIGMAFVAAGLAASSVARTLTEVYVAYVIGIGVGVGCSYVPSIGAVQRWFTRRRGLASGLAVSGIGFGTLILPPVSAMLIQAYGWRSAYLALAAFALIAGVGMSLLIQNDPRDRGLSPDGDTPCSDAQLAPATGMSVGDAVRSRRFIGLYVSCLFCGFGVFVPFAHLVPYATDQGLAASAGALLLGAIGIGSTAGRFLLGAVADRIGRRSALLVSFAGMGLAFAIWAVAKSFWPLALFALLYGTFYGGWVALLPTVVMDDFGGRNVSGIIGILYTSAAWGTLLGPSAAGFIFDASGSYVVAILASAAGNVIAVAIFAATSSSRA